MTAMSVAPDLLQPVIGFRKWRLEDDHLCSPYVRVHWRERVMHADCHGDRLVSALFERRSLRVPHDAPHPLCNCGIYAYYEPQGRPRAIYVRLVWGIVTLRGRIEAHGNGMRGELAHVEALASSPEWPRAHQREVERIATELGIDVVRHTQLKQAAKHYGEPLPPSLIP